MKYSKFLAIVMISLFITALAASCERRRMQPEGAPDNTDGIDGEGIVCIEGLRQLNAEIDSVLSAAE